jgi:hypothetical protein
MEKTVLEVEPGAATDQQAQPHPSPPPSGGKGDGRKSLLGDAEKLKELRYVRPPPLPPAINLVPHRRCSKEPFLAHQRRATQNTSKVERHLKQLVKSGEELQKAREGTLHSDLLTPRLALRPNARRSLPLPLSLFLHRVVCQRAAVGNGHGGL